MAETMNPNNGYCITTKTYHSLRNSIPLPPKTTALSITDYILSLLRSSSDFSLASPFLINASSSLSLSFSSFLRHVNNLTSSLPPIPIRHVALILSPPSFYVPILYFSLMSLNVIVSPANPLSTYSELTHLIDLSNPAVIFTVMSLLPKLSSFNIPVILLDSPEFEAMLTQDPSSQPRQVSVSQNDTAVILYSSGTTGRVKGVELSHRNLIAITASYYYIRFDKKKRVTRPISLIPIPLFHVFGLTMLLRGVGLGETLVVMERFNFDKMLEAVERFKVTFIMVSPPLIVALIKSEMVEKYEISSLERIGCGGAPLGREVAERFKARFPTIEIVQGYGMTETGGGATRTIGPEECERYDSVGRLQELMEAKIVDPLTGEALTPGQCGELWLRGPTIMKGYVGNKEATAATFHADGWLKTGDHCYFDDDGCLHVIDRLKELIKYKGYQVPPAELEYLLLSHPEIDDVAVVPYPDEEAGEIPMAFVVKKSGSSISEPQVMSYVAEQVSPYKKIRRVSFINVIPRNTSGKILRRELVDQAKSTLLKL